jgi:hypothetical protein
MCGGFSPHPGSPRSTLHVALQRARGARDQRRSSDSMACDPTASCVASRAPGAGAARGDGGLVAHPAARPQEPDSRREIIEAALGSLDEADLGVCPGGSGGYDRSRLRRPLSGLSADPIGTAGPRGETLARARAPGPDPQAADSDSDTAERWFPARGRPPSARGPGGSPAARSGDSRISGSRARNGVLISAAVAAGAAVWRPPFVPGCGSGKGYGQMPSLRGSRICGRCHGSSQKGLTGFQSGETVRGALRARDGNGGMAGDGGTS